jgi:hypothetical protein
MTTYTKPALPEPYCYEFRDPKERYTAEQTQAHADACVAEATEALRAELAECNERRNETIAMCEQLKAELAHIRAEQGAPVAWIDAVDLDLLRNGSHADFVVGGIRADGDEPLFAAPPQPLTLSDEQIKRVYFTCSSGKMTPTMYEFARASLAVAQEHPK